MKLDVNKLKWTREPMNYSIDEENRDYNKALYRFMAKNLLSFL